MTQEKSLQFAKKIIARLKDALKIRTDTELAEYLGVRQSTISTWKSRDSVDFKLIIAKCNDISLDYLVYGRDPPENQNEVSAQEPQASYNQSIPTTEKDRVIQVQERYIANLEQQVDDLRAQVRDLKRDARSAPDTTPKQNRRTG